MLGKEYIKINGIAIPNPVAFKTANTPIENVSQSESGRDLVQVIRIQKLTADCSSDCTSMWADKLEAYSLMNTCTVMINGKTYYVRIRNFTKTLVEDSEMIKGTDGLWKVTFKILEI